MIRYEVSGSVRGLISRHRTLSGAVASQRRDQRSCARLGGGAYSDATVHPLTDDAQAEYDSWSEDEGDPA